MSFVFYLVGIFIGPFCLTSWVKVWINLLSAYHYHVEHKLNLEPFTSHPSFLPLIQARDGGRDPYKDVEAEMFVEVKKKKKKRPNIM